MPVTRGTDCLCYRYHFMIGNYVCLLCNRYRSIKFQIHTFIYIKRANLLMQKKIHNATPPFCTIFSPNQLLIYFIKTDMNFSETQLCLQLLRLKMPIGGSIFVSNCSIHTRQLLEGNCSSQTTAVFPRQEASRRGAQEDWELCTFDDSQISFHQKEINK